ncbi:hypothetical protein ScPMuIL_004471 [Solemya velum]
MGAGASSYNHRTTSNASPSVRQTKSLCSMEKSGNTIQKRFPINKILWTNQVAPIVIKNCREEFQHISDMKEPIVWGRLGDNMVEHPLIRGKFFLLRDVEGQTLRVQRAHGGFSVYGAEQPSPKGLSMLLDNLVADGYSRIFVFNLREEPVLFVKTGDDYVPFSLYDQDNVADSILKGRTPKEANEFEAKIRKEVLDISKLLDQNKFYFYNNLEVLENEPHLLPVEYEDNILVAEEVYSRLLFSNPNLRYQRLCFPLSSAPRTREVDDFLQVFKENPSLFDMDSSSCPALLFTCQTGVCRSTVGMVMGCLVLAHKKGIISKSNHLCQPLDEQNPDYARGEYAAIQQLVKLIPNGLETKYQVDEAIDMCSQLCNLRQAILEAKELLEGITTDYIIENTSAKAVLYDRCVKYLHRYYFLICFNSYLHQQFCQRFSISFSVWMQSHPELIRLQSNLNHPLRQSPHNLVFQQTHCLVYDDYIGLDVLSSQMDVRASNFRRISTRGLAIYGMAQPARDGFSKVARHLMEKKPEHECVVFINLRNDVMIECDGMTYSVRDKSMLDEPITFTGLTKKEIEEKEKELKREMKIKKSAQVYHELSDPPLFRQFVSVMSPCDLAEYQRQQTANIQYYRIPLFHDITVEEKDYDHLLSVVCEHQLFNKSEDSSGPAFVFFCRTGKSRTTLMMAAAGLILCHLKGFPYGSGLGEQERISLPNAQYTKGDFLIVQKLVRILPQGQQLKREVDFILDECFDTMSPMHFHIREVIFVTYNKMKSAKTEEQRQKLQGQCMDFLERYIYLILFNAYLHLNKSNRWERPFSQWMAADAKRCVYDSWTA